MLPPGPIGRRRAGTPQHFDRGALGCGGRRAPGHGNRRPGRAHRARAHGLVHPHAVLDLDTFTVEEVEVFREEFVRRFAPAVTVVRDEHPEAIPLPGPGHQLGSGLFLPRVDPRFSHGKQWFLLLSLIHI